MPELGRLVVVGLGLIGGSLAKGLREAGLFAEVIGVERNPNHSVQALQQGLVDRCCVSLGEALQNGADMLVLAVPLSAMPELLQELAERELGDCVITDVGSAKRPLLEAAGAAFGEIPPNFVAGHPIAGSEKSGPMAADSALFQGRSVILTPIPETAAFAVQRVQRLWRTLGAQVHLMSAEQHDEVLAATSHLPHMLAFVLTDELARRQLLSSRIAAGGLRDVTRIAASDPLMWRDIALANRDYLLAELKDFRAALDDLSIALKKRDSQQLFDLFSRAKAAREPLFPTSCLSKPMLDNDLIFLAAPGGVLHGKLRVPGDKSISHRSIMLGSIAEGVSEINGFLEGEDALATLQAFRAMGVRIDGPDNGRVKIYGVGLYGLKAPTAPLYLGNSGTSMRLLAGLLAAQPFDVTLTGDESLSKRPMNRVVEPLRQMGAVIETAENGRPPLHIKGGQTLRGLDYVLPMASAQVKSCLLLAGLYAEGTTRVTEPAPTRDHSERMLRGLGWPLLVDERQISLESGHGLHGGVIDIAADISSAAFFMVAASIAEGSDVLLEQVGINPTRDGVIRILRLMGADITLENPRKLCGEPVADIRVRSAKLHGIEIPEDLVPLAIDEFPVLFIAAACASGRTVLRGAAELRVKESDRIQVMADGLQTLSVSATPTEDGMIIQGGTLGGGEVWAHGDHRIAMSFAVAALKASAPIRIHDCANVATSFPNFVGLAQQAGMRIEVEDKA